MEEFNFSEEVIRLRMRWMILVFPIIVIGVNAFLLLKGVVKPSMLWPLAVSGIIILAVILPLTFFSTAKRLREMKVLVNEERIIKQVRDVEESVLWPEVVKARITLNPRGDVEEIRIISSDKQTLHINGFEGMDKIQDFVKQNVKANTKIEIRQQKIDWFNPLTGIAVAVTMVIVFGAIYSGDITRHLFDMLFPLCAGCYVLTFRPLTKMNLKMRRLEILFGIALLLMAISEFVQ